MKGKHFIMKKHFVKHEQELLKGLKSECSEVSDIYITFTDESQKSLNSIVFKYENPEHTKNLILEFYVRIEENLLIEDDYFFEDTETYSLAAALEREQKGCYRKIDRRTLFEDFAFLSNFKQITMQEAYNKMMEEER